MRCYCRAALTDEYERQFPALGLITVQDTETKSLQVIDARRSGEAIFLAIALEEQKRIFNKYRVDVIDIIQYDSFDRSFNSFF